MFEATQNAAKTHLCDLFKPLSKLALLSSLDDATTLWRSKSKLERATYTAATKEQTSTHWKST